MNIKKKFKVAVVITFAVIIVLLFLIYNFYIKDIELGCKIYGGTVREVKYPGVIHNVSICEEGEKNIGSIKYLKCPCHCCVPYK